MASHTLYLYTIKPAMGSNHSNVNGVGFATVYRTATHTHIYIYTLPGTHTHAHSLTCTQTCTHGHTCTFTGNHIFMH